MLGLKNSFDDLYQRLGLKLINRLAHSGRYHLNSDLPFADQSRNKLDQYLVNNELDRPTVVFFYGGNWRSGSRQDFRFVADTLTLHGFNVIIPDYRLYPDVKFNQIMTDAVAAMHWALDHVPSDQAVFLMGHSAGAQLASLLCLNQSLVGSKMHGRIAGFIGLAGPYDFYPFTEDDHWDLFAPEQEYAQSQAVNYVRGDAPPLYLLHGADDTRVRRGHSKSLMEKIHAVDGKADREVYDGMGHVDIILSFMRFNRQKSKVVQDLVRFVTDQTVKFNNQVSQKNFKHQMFRRTIWHLAHQAQKNC